MNIVGKLGLQEFGRLIDDVARIVLAGNDVADYDRSPKR